MHAQTRRLATAAAVAMLTLPLFQSCTIVVPPVNAFLDFQNVPHFDGDGEDSFLDRLFGFDDDDD